MGPEQEIRAICQRGHQHAADPQRDVRPATHTCSDQNFERLNDLAWQHSQQDLHQATAIDWNELHTPSDTSAAPTNF